MTELPIDDMMRQLGQQARRAATTMAAASCGQKNEALRTIAEILLNAEAKLLEANRADLKAGREKGLDPALLDRLELSPERIASMAEGCEQIATLPDPVGEISELSYRPSGIQVGKMRVPLGVIGIIYESRPNVTVDAAALCLKSGNATVLRGGSEAINSNRAIAECISQGLTNAGLPAAAVQLIGTTDRSAVDSMITMPEYIDVIVPRGGKGLIERISQRAKVPVIKHLDGICHVYIDQAADLKKAYDIAINSKTHRYGVCNAMETLLIHKSVAAQLLPKLANEYQHRGVELRGCPEVRKIVSSESILPATEEDWHSEYLAPILSIRVVDDAVQAMEHIEKYSSAHTESIVTEDFSLARQFMAAVDSSSVMVNASTRFADGFEYGLGAEIGISTDKLHARGPVGLEGLTSQKYIVFGDGHIRQ